MQAICFTFKSYNNWESTPIQICGIHVHAAIMCNEKFIWSFMKFRQDNILYNKRIAIAVERWILVKFVF